MLGLVQAIKRFNPERDARLSTYASFSIRAAIQDHVVRSWSLVRLSTSSAQRSMFLHLRRRTSDFLEGADALGEDFAARVAKARKLSNEAIVAAVLAMDEAALDEAVLPFCTAICSPSRDSPYNSEWGEGEWQHGPRVGGSEAEARAKGGGGPAGQRDAAGGGGGGGGGVQQPERDRLCPDAGLDLRGGAVHRSKSNRGRVGRVAKEGSGWYIIR
jgi:hypothetical protein